MLLDDPQSCSQLRSESLCVFNSFWARRKALKEELITLLKPDVNSSHGTVSEGPNDHLLVDTVVDLQHADLLAPCQRPGDPQVHVRAPVVEHGGKDVARLDVDADPGDQGNGDTISVDTCYCLSDTQLNQLEIVWVLLNCGCNKRVKLILRYNIFMLK